MPSDRNRKLSKHFALSDFLVDETFPNLAASLDPDGGAVENLTRLAAIMDRIVESFGTHIKVLSGYRDEALNDACRDAGLPASIHSLHLFGCAADLELQNREVDPETVFNWLRDQADELALGEVVYYPRKGFIHVAVLDTKHPTSRRILMRT